MLKTSLTEILYVMCGIVCFYSAYATFKDEKHSARFSTVIFWTILGVIFTFSRFGMIWGNKELMIPDVVVGYLVIVLVTLSAFKLVKVGKYNESTIEFKKAMAEKIGDKIFIPALSLGILTFIIAQIWNKQLGSLVALGISTILSAIIARIITKGKASEMADEGRRLLELVGPVSLLPQLLAALGAVFAAAGVGEVISSALKNVIPQGNVLLGVIAYCVGMALFTMIMGNAFAAFAVITAGIGVPLVIAQGGNPIIVSALGLTAGYCGTLMTPMAANFNIVPTAILEMEDKKYGVIKYQIPVAIVMLTIHIILMYILAF